MGAKILDFGLAKLASTPELSSDSDETLRGTVNSDILLLENLPE